MASVSAFIMSASTATTYLNLPIDAVFDTVHVSSSIDTCARVLDAPLNTVVPPLQFLHDTNSSFLVNISAMAVATERTVVELYLLGHVQSGRGRSLGTRQNLKNAETSSGSGSLCFVVLTSLIILGTWMVTASGGSKSVEQISKGREEEGGGESGEGRVRFPGADSGTIPISWNDEDGIVSIVGRINPRLYQDPSFLEVAVEGILQQHAASDTHTQVEEVIYYHWDNGVMLQLDFPDIRMVYAEFCDILDGVLATQIPVVVRGYFYS